MTQGCDQKGGRKTFGAMVWLEFASQGMLLSAQIACLSSCRISGVLKYQVSMEVFMVSHWEDICSFRNVSRLEGTADFPTSLLWILSTGCSQIRLPFFVLVGLAPKTWSWQWLPLEGDDAPTRWLPSGHGTAFLPVLEDFCSQILVD